ncbi:TetR/AcrR family transcriptional regulator [Streptomyces sp. DSM 44917]|uniref:TetR/AcrR family transcriptional regulator n=1 Tax=Streptomyces boetiae TaxID=3075541 RepID=A0ABU2L9Z3_9ACTN|nr:TetR/AcrR family transcriptional regulator [Streptomyces sp. DSM 44917]MDT0308322.1 TetR/AcrR family transcriptional regulator [Streptomyces sp. DSM 44917]
MSSRPAPPGPAYRRLSVAQRREQLILTAQRLFARNVPEDVSLDDVARAAGVSRPLVYRYFPGGKQQLYEAALQHAADDLRDCFAVPPAGPLSERLASGVDRYLAFVDEHAEGFTALLKGGSVVETSRTSAIVDGVRRAAAQQVLIHLEVEQPGRRLGMTLRTWITAVEAASLIWLDEDRQPPVEELRDWLVEQLLLQITVTALQDGETARVLLRAAELEPVGGRVDSLIERLRMMMPLVSPRPSA